MDERDVAVLQPFDVAHHLRLRQVAVEDGVGQKVAGALERRVVVEAHTVGQGLDVDLALGRAENGEQLLQFFDSCGFVEGDADAIVAIVAQVDAAALGRAANLGHVAPAAIDGQGVEDVGRTGVDLIAQLAQARGQHAGQ